MMRWNVSSRPSFVLAGTSALALAVALSFVTSAPAAPKDKDMLRDFMRKKLDASSQVLEGLATEDFKLIGEGADALNKMSAAELFNVILDDDYRDFNREFRASVAKLRTAAKDENLDGATLQWVDAVKSCVECHKYVRGQRGALKK